MVANKMADPGESERYISLRCVQKAQNIQFHRPSVSFQRCRCPYRIRQIGTAFSKNGNRAGEKGMKWEGSLVEFLCLTRQDAGQLLQRGCPCGLVQHHV